ncbi:MAG: hypothetical protein EXR79_04685 [Myxococcales bacterium]|nr:hypothetical protein [Myxococcales bacterium]
MLLPKLFAPIVRALAIVAVSVTAGSACAAANEQLLLQYLDDTPVRAGGVWCSAVSVEHEAQLQLREYLPPELTVHRWQGGAPAPDEPPLPEAQFFAALEQRTVQLVLITALAGLGTTRFADTMEASLCRTRPILRIEGNPEFAARVKAAKEGDDPVAEAIAQRLGVPDPAKQGELRALLDTARWVLLIDSLHDLPPADRGLVIRHLQGYIDRHPRNLQTVVLARPNVVRGDELGVFDAVLEIPELTCARTEAKVQHALRSKPRADRFWQWAKATGVDDQVRDGAACRYRYLSTFRAVQVGIEVAVAGGIDQPQADFDAALALPPETRVEKFTSAFLAPDARKLGIEPGRLVHVAAKLVASVEPGKAGEAAFTVPGCAKLVDGVSGLKDREFACERVLGVPLFVQVGDGLWRLEPGPLGEWLRSTPMASSGPGQ